MKRAAFFAWLLLGVIWGSNFIFMKWATEYITPMQVTLVRVIFGFLPVLIYALLTRQLRVSDLRNAGHFFVMACLAAVVYYYGFARGTQLLPSGIAGAISGAIPLFSMLSAVLLLSEEKFNRSRVLGIMIGLLGVLAIARPFGSDIEPGSLEGVGFMVIGSLSLGVSFVYARRFVTPLRLSAAALTTYQLGIASLILLAITPLEGVDQIVVDTRALVGLVIGLGLLGTGFAYILYYYIIKNLGAVSASTVTYLPPVVALMIGAFLVGEPMVLMDYLGAGFILVGVFVMSQRSQKN